MHLSTAGQLAHPAEDGGRRMGRHRDGIVTNGHGLAGREQSDNGGYDRAMTDEQTETDGQKYGRTDFSRDGRKSLSPKRELIDRRLLSDYNRCTVKQV